MNKFLLFIPMIFVVNLGFAQISDSSNLLVVAYANKNQILLDSFLNQWHQESIPYDISTTSELMTNIYEIYKVIYDVPEYFPWAFRHTLQTKKAYRLIKSPHFVSVRPLVIKAETEKILVHEKIKIAGKKAILKPIVFKYKRKLKSLKKYSDFMYYNEKYQFADSGGYFENIKYFSPNIENDSIKLLFINEKYKSIIEQFMQRSIYSFSDYPNEKEAFFLNKVAYWRCPTIYDIDINPEFDFAIIRYAPYCLSCYTGLKRSSIFLKKSEGKWEIIYPTAIEPYLFYKERPRDNFFDRKIRKLNLK